MCCTGDFRSNAAKKAHAGGHAKMHHNRHSALKWLMWRDCHSADSAGSSGGHDDPMPGVSSAVVSHSFMNNPVLSFSALAKARCHVCVLGRPVCLVGVLL
eukprot:6466677-Amphidinium_carterae.3